MSVRLTIVFNFVIAVVVMTGSVSAECITVPLTSRIKDAEILMLARVDAAPNPAPNQPNFIDGTHVVTVTVKTLWKGNTPRQIELRQNFNAENPPFWTSIGKDLVLSVRRLTLERPLGTPTMKPFVASGFTAEACNWRLAEKVDLNKLGRGRSPND
jgi:hypothetical protein